LHPGRDVDPARPEGVSLLPVNGEPTILAALSAELRRLERTAAARETLEPERAIELYGLVGEVRDALERLAGALEDSRRASE
jgi:hypothetical protein